MRGSERSRRLRLVSGAFDTVQWLSRGKTAATGIRGLHGQSYTLCAWEQDHLGLCRWVFLLATQSFCKTTVEAAVQLHFTKSSLNPFPPLPRGLSAFRRAEPLPTYYHNNEDANT